MAKPKTQKRVVRVEIFGDLDWSVMERIWPFLKAADRPDTEFELVISSGGGDTEVGYTLFNAIRSLHSAKTRAVAMGLVGSAAVTVYLACEERLAVAGASIYLHNGSICFDEARQSMSLDEIRRLTRDLQIENGRNIDILVDRTGLREIQVRQLCDDGRTLTAADALEFGIVTRILGP
ncbi:MAG: ATP-dependent Clp protease proteolytic subunit, partial [Patescibacteria group bacterium]|nr:ATP-dependent Clp protease proteolytic subunit [Patescibacteria group bacterium]